MYAEDYPYPRSPKETTDSSGSVEVTETTVTETADEVTVTATSEEDDKKKNKRRKHKKSRNGCFNCKKLRIKCDESHPVCKNCHQRHKECVWPTVAKAKDREGKASELSPTELAASALMHSTSKQTIRPTSMARMFDVDFADLELLRFYVEHTSPQLTKSCGDADYSWVRSIPSMTIVNAALYKCVLTVASIHKAHMYLPEKYTYDHEYARERKRLRKHLEKRRDRDNPSMPIKLPPPDMTRVTGYLKPNSQLLEKIVKAFTEALAGHRESLVTLNASNQESILSTSVVIFMIALALGELIPLINFEGGADVIGVGRGVIELVFQLSAKDRMVLFPLPPPMPNRSYLPNEPVLWQLISTIPDMGHRQLCSMELQQLIELYNLDVKHRGQSHLPGWATYISGGFLQATRAGDPYCLVILGHYCAYAHMSHSFFWLRDRLSGDLEAIVDVLPEDLHHYLDWPRRTCGRFDMNYQDLISGRLQKLTLEDKDERIDVLPEMSEQQSMLQVDLLQQQQQQPPLQEPMHQERRQSNQSVELHQSELELQHSNSSLDDPHLQQHIHHQQQQQQHQQQHSSPQDPLPDMYQYSGVGLMDHNPLKMEHNTPPHGSMSLSYGQ